MGFWVTLSYRLIIINPESKSRQNPRQGAALRVNLNVDGVSITSKTHTNTSHSQTSRLLTSSLSLGVPVPRETQCIRGV
jgi:hypothetical protein